MSRDTKEVGFFTAILVAIAILQGGCSPAEQQALADTLKPVIKMTCAVARRVVQACPYAESAVGSSGGEEDEDDADRAD